MTEHNPNDELPVQIDEKDIVGYLVDENDVQVGVIVLDEDGDEVEVYFEGDFDDYEEVEDSQDQVVEVEVDEDDILYYFVDKSGREIGFAAKGEDGQKVEYFYPEDEEPSEPEKSSAMEKSGLPIIGDAVSKDDLKDMAGTIKDVAMEGYSTLADIMDQVDDMRDSLDAINPKKRRQARREAKRNAALSTPPVSPGEE
ncbi:MAG: hypothetical protein PUA57_03680 [Eggerthellales bacterium]|nr:hypothetical protein [Eggerthellales bacterium]